MSSNEAAPARVVPAHLDFLAVYNPGLGLTEDTEKDQIVFYWSKVAQDIGNQTDKDDRNAQTARDKANEQLRQIGLAQGIVHFAKGFAKGEAVDSIDTEKHRIVLQQIEDGWWILASVNLSILPTSRRTPATEALGSTQIEYSAREVSSPSLLLAQLTAAHRIFQLHHGPSLSDLYTRVKRPKFCNLLDIFWTTFACDWDVLLHGNPAVDIYNGIKLAAGGELGMGVGEEEWGSGERDALEGIVSSTDGLVDVVVSRFGHAAAQSGLTTPESSSQRDDPQHDTLTTDEPWLGSLRQPDAVDGVIFTGVGAVSRTTLRSLSSWMSTIYTNGDDAYGILDNPTSGRRNRRRHASHRSSVQASLPPKNRDSAPLAVRRGNTDETITEKTYEAATGTHLGNSSAEGNEADEQPKVTVEEMPQKRQDEHIAQQDHDQIAADLPKPVQDDSRTTDPARGHGPSIPPPIVSAAEDALNQATEQADEAARKRATKEKGSSSAESGMDNSGHERWSKYLKLGYGSSWSIPGLQKDAGASNTSSAGLSKGQEDDSSDIRVSSPGKDPRRGDTLSGFMPPPMPISGSVGGSPSISGGRYLIGLKGDLSSFGDESGRESDGSESQEDGGDRIVLRTIHAGINVPEKAGSVKGGGASSRSRAFYDENGSIISTIEMKRLRVVVYVNQPFIFTFLFDLTYGALSTPSFFRTLHSNLAPLHKPLLASTSPSNVAFRLTGFLTIPTPHADATDGPSPIYDLVHDPYNITVHTSIPNIPVPGTLAAEGLTPYSFPFAGGSASKIPVAPWTRVEALNVHSQILNSYADTRRQDGDREHQAKTSRGWWVVWMRLTATATYDSASEGHGGSMDGEGFREAVLIRHASDHFQAHRGEGSSRKASGYGLGRFVGRDSQAGAIGSEGGNGSEAEGASGSRGGPGRITEGIGVDARKYVESLLSLSR